MTSSTGLCRGHSRQYGFHEVKNVDDGIDGRVDGCTGGLYWVVGRHDLLMTSSTGITYGAIVGGFRFRIQFMIGDRRVWQLLMLDSGNFIS